MTNDALLRDALLDAAAAEFACELSDPAPVAVSPRLLRQMTAMLNDPPGWVKRQRRSVWQRLARTAAAILLVLSLSLGALMAVSPTVRAAVKNWILETYEHCVNYRFFGKAPEARLPNYAPTWLPDGFVLDERSEWEDRVFSIYHSTAQDGGFTFNYYSISEDIQIQIGGYDNTPVSALEECTVNGMNANYYPADISGNSNLIWVDQERGIIFCIGGTPEKDDMLHIAESVSLVDPTY